eukprot:350000-Chlamydomonas_euryale.AAC.6
MAHVTHQAAGQQVYVGAFGLEGELRHVGKRVVDALVGREDMKGLAGACVVPGQASGGVGWLQDYA